MNPWGHDTSWGMEGGKSRRDTVIRRYKSRGIILLLLTLPFELAFRGSVRLFQILRQKRRNRKVREFIRGEGDHKSI